MLLLKSYYDVPNCVRLNQRHKIYNFARLVLRDEVNATIAKKASQRMKLKRRNGKSEASDEVIS